VYHIFNVSSTKGLKEHFILPEWQFIQYILPCFVTQIGHLATNSKIKPSELHNFTRFVHNLIQSFEVNLKKTHIIEGNLKSNLKMTEKVVVPDWFSNNQATNVSWQLQEVERELGMMVHGTHKKIKKAGSADFPLGQICFLQLAETLRNGVLNRSRPLMFKWWSETILHYVPKLRGAIFKEVMISTNPFPTNNLLQALAVLEELKNISVTLNFNPVDELILECLDMADQKLKIMMELQPGPLRRKIERKRFVEIQRLTVQQLLGVALFGIVVSWQTKDSNLLEIFDPTKIFRSAIINSAIEKLVASDWRGLRCLLTPLLSDSDGIDLSLVTMDFAKKSASACYLRVHEAIKMKDSKKKYFLSLSPVIPIKFCRYCEKFEVELKKCRICVDNPDFPDIHWFCSDDCEDKVLVKMHLEEHDHDLMVKLGLV
jgi:RNase P subunit RPR2